MSLLRGSMAPGRAPKVIGFAAQGLPYLAIPRSRQVLPAAFSCGAGAGRIIKRKGD